MSQPDDLRARLQRHSEAVIEARWFRFIRSAVTLFSARRCFGMSAEAAFWAFFTLPFLLVGLLAATAGVAEAFGEDVTQDVRDTIIDASSRVLTPEAVQDLIVPLLDSVLAGSSGLSLFGLAAALWSGSRIFVTFAEGSVALHGHPARGYVRTRGLGLLAYVIGLGALAGIAASVALFPNEASAVVGIVPGSPQVWTVILGLVFLVAACTTMMFVVNPRRSRWRHQLPGGFLAVAIWLIGSLGLQLYFTWLFRSGSVYGAIASITAVLVWALVTSTAVFVGMTLNSTVRSARDGVYLTPAIVAQAEELGMRVADEAAADEKAAEEKAAEEEAVEEEAVGEAPADEAAAGSVAGEPGA